MTLYFGNNWKAHIKPQTDPIWQVRVACLSYLFRSEEVVKRFAKLKTRAFLDSGAFSYWVDRAVYNIKVLDELVDRINQATLPTARRSLF